MSYSRLPRWIADVCADEQCGLAGFAAGLIPDLDAVVYGMSTDWSSGPVEGRVNDLKALKRSMFGRAKPPLLRKRLPPDRRQPPTTHRDDRLIDFTKSVPEPWILTHPDALSESERLKLKSGRAALNRTRSPVMSGRSGG